MTRISPAYHPHITRIYNCAATLAQAAAYERERQAGREGGRERQRERVMFNSAATLAQAAASYLHIYAHVCSRMVTYGDVW